MISLLGKANFIIQGFALIVMLFDKLVYTLMAFAYKLFFVCTQIDIFGTEPGQKIYADFTKRIYGILVVVMIFVVAYLLLMKIINPDGQAPGQKIDSKKLVPSVIWKLALLIALPWLFEQAYILQSNLLKDSTIANIIFGSGGTPSDSSGESIALTLYTGLFHPVGSDLSDFLQTKEVDGKMETSIRDDFEERCKNNGANKDACSAYSKAINKWVQNKSFTGFMSSDVREQIGEDDGIEYGWLFGTAAGVWAAWCFLSYSFDMGKRAVKLGFLELIAPVPVAMSLTPQGKNWMSNWSKDWMKTYLQVFIQEGFMFLAVYLCSLVPLAIDAVWADSVSEVNGFGYKAYATVVLILGILSFLKEAPEMLKHLFPVDAFNIGGVKFMPGVKERVKEPIGVAKTIGGAVGGTAAGTYGAFLSMKKGFQDYDKLNKDRKSGVNGLLYAPTFLKGIGAGMKTGYKTGKTDGVAAAGMAAARENVQYRAKKAETAQSRHDRRMNAQVPANASIGDKIGATAGYFGGEVVHAVTEAYNQKIGDNVTAIKTAAASNVSVTDSKRAQAAKAIQTQMDGANDALGKAAATKANYDTNMSEAIKAFGKDGTTITDDAMKSLKHSLAKKFLDQKIASGTETIRDSADYAAKLAAEMQSIQESRVRTYVNNHSDEYGKLLKDGYDMRTAELAVSELAKEERSEFFKRRQAITEAYSSLKSTFEATDIAAFDKKIQDALHDSSMTLDKYLSVMGDKTAFESIQDVNVRNLYESAWADVTKSFKTISTQAAERQAALDTADALGSVRRPTPAGGNGAGSAPKGK